MDTGDFRGGSGVVQLVPGTRECTVAYVVLFAPQ